MTDGPLHGIRVLDLSRILAGPTATQLLGDYGADVIKVEKPGTGDDTRSWGPPFVKDADGKDTGESAYYLAANRNKRSIALDIATPEGAAEVKRLAATADVLVENFKVGGLAKFGLGYEDLRADFPGLIYCSITGYGQTGPNAAKPGYDLLAQGEGGIMSLTGGGAEPMKVGVAVSDVVCGLYAVTAILAALHHRQKTGAGQWIDIGLLDTQVAWLVNQGTNYLTSGTEPPRLGNQHPNIVPYQVFAVSDGHVIVAVGNDSQFARFATLIGAPGLAEDARFATNSARLAHRGTLIPLIEGLVAGIAQADLLARMTEAKVPGGPINTLSQVFGSAQAEAREMVIEMDHAAGVPVRLIGNPVKFSATPVSYRRAPPPCGADTAEIRAELAAGRAEPGESS